VEYKVQQSYLELQQKLAQAELSKALAAQEVPNRADLNATADFLKAELMKLQAQMKALEAQRDAELMKFRQSATTPESAMAAQSQLSVLEAQQQALGQKLVDVEVAARQRELERQKRSETVSVAEYRIKSGDVIAVFIFNHAELSAKGTVLPDGRITTPLVQSIPAAGLTPTELKAAIESRLKEFIDKPNVTVMVEPINLERR
jgi:hypothetical protein